MLGNWFIFENSVSPEDRFVLSSSQSMPLLLKLSTPNFTQSFSYLLPTFRYLHVCAISYRLVGRLFGKSSRNGWKCPFLSFWPISEIQKNSTIYVIRQFRLWPWIWPWPWTWPWKSKNVFSTLNGHISLSNGQKSFKFCVSPYFWARYEISSKNLERNFYFRFSRKWP